MLSDHIFMSHLFGSLIVFSVGLKILIIEVFALCFKE